MKSQADSHKSLFNQPAFQRLIPFSLPLIMMENILLYADGCSHHMPAPVIFDKKKFGKMLYHNLWVTLNDDLEFQIKMCKVLLIIQ